MALEKTIILVTGGNAGIGFELAAQFIPNPTAQVILGCRSTKKGEVALQKLQSREQHGTTKLLKLDVVNNVSILSAANLVKSKHGRYA